MRKVTLLILAAALFVGISCVPNLDEINSRLDALEKAVAELNSLNTTVNGFSTAIKALESNVAVTSVRKNADGYTINFSDGTSATISNGKDGNAGPKGDKGDKGDTPQVGFKNVDGVLVWTVNGEVIKDPDGNPVPASASVPEFKFEDGTWYCRANGGDWVECGSADGEGAQITETNDAVVITVGDTSIVIPKDVIAPDITGITRKTLKLFIPKGQSIDLKEWFDVAPEGAMKAGVDYYLTGDMFTVTDDGILGAVGQGACSVYISSKNDEDIETYIAIRTCDVPTNNEVASTINPAEKHYLFDSTFDGYNGLVSTGGATAFNPLNNSLSALVGNGGLLNVYFKPQPFDANVTLENGHLHFMIYIRALDKLNPDGGQLELCSGGNPDTHERSWSTSFLKKCKPGWNEVILDFKDSANSSADGDCDLTNINWFRIYVPTTAENDEAVQIKDMYIYAEPVPAVSEVSVTLKKNTIFVPVGKSVDLKDFIKVGPVGASKAGLTYTPAAGAPFTIDKDGILTATGDGNYSITIAAGDVSATMYARTCATPKDEEIASAVSPASKVYLFDSSVKGFNNIASFGGACNWAPLSNSIAGLMGAGGLLNIYFRPQPTDAKVTATSGHLHFMIYVSTVDKLNFDGGALELGSGGNPDTKERSWSTSLLKNIKVGWNEVVLDLKDTSNSSTDGDCDFTKINWFRLFIPTTADLDEAVQIKDLYFFN